MEIREYIESGILETYVLGVATQEEVKELERLKNRYPEINDALTKLEIDLENIAQQMAITPPPAVWHNIEDEIVNDLIKQNNPPSVRIQTNNRNYQYNAPSPNNFIEVEGQSSHMRVHKAWRWVLAAIFVLGKIFLAFAIYYYLENRQITQQLNELKLEKSKK